MCVTGGITCACTIRELPWPVRDVSWFMYGKSAYRSWKQIGHRLERSWTQTGSNQVRRWYDRGQNWVSHGHVGSTLSARSESESETESYCVVVYAGRRQSSGDEERVLSVPIDCDRRLGWPVFGSAPRLSDTKKAGQFKRGPGTVVPSCGI